MTNLYPSQEFWESSLEMPASSLFDSFKNLNIRNNWINSLSGKQLTVIFNHHFKDKQSDISVQQKRAALIKISDSLFNYYLVSCFSHTKLDLAILEVAKAALSEVL